MLQVQLFGAGRVLDDVGEIKLPSRAWTLPLLAYLLFHRGEVLPRQRVAFALWPDEMEETALKNLRRNLHRLTQALPAIDGAEPWIVSAGHSIAWNTSAACEVDVIGVRPLTSGFSNAGGGGCGLLRRLARGIPRRLDRCGARAPASVYQTALRELIVEHRSRRAFASASHYAQQLLDTDAWHEDVLRQLMSVRYESGDAAGAIAAFAGFAERLRTEMRVEPMAETIALRDAIARGAPIPGAFGYVETDRKVGRAQAPFVGRPDDLARLRGQWLRAAGGRGGIGFVRGEAGIGKSRLVSELALIVEAEGGRVITGTTSSPERDPYQSLVSALRGALPLVAQTNVTPPLLAAVAAVVPELRSEEPDLPAVRAHGAEARARAVHRRLDAGDCRARSAPPAARHLGGRPPGRLRDVGGHWPHRAALGAFAGTRARDVPARGGWPQPATARARTHAASDCRTLHPGSARA